MSLNNFSTESGNRTHTSVRTLDFESSASTSFAISAIVKKNDFKVLNIKKENIIKK